MKFLEKLLVYGLFNDGKTIGFWDLNEIHDKLWGKNIQPWTFAEKHALMFFEEMGDYMGEKEKWVRPYGNVLNEHRSLH